MPSVLENELSLQEIKTNEFNNVGASETIYFNVEVPEPFPTAPVAAASIATVAVVRCWTAGVLQETQALSRITLQSSVYVVISNLFPKEKKKGEVARETSPLGVRFKS